MFLPKSMKSNHKQLQHIAKTILRETMGTVGEICVFVNYSLKRKKMLGKLTKNMKGTFDPDEQQASKLDNPCVTRWTVRATCLKKIIDNYEPLLKLWKESLKEKLDAETTSRIIGCKKQMESFKFYFAIYKSYMHTPITFPKSWNRKICL